MVFLGLQIKKPMRFLVLSDFSSGTHFLQKFDHFRPIFSKTHSFLEIWGHFIVQTIDTHEKPQKWGLKRFPSQNIAPNSHFLSIFTHKKYKGKMTIFVIPSRTKMLISWARNSILTFRKKRWLCNKNVFPINLK